MNTLIFHIWVTVAVVLAVTYGALDIPGRTHAAAERAGRITEHVLAAWCLAGLVCLVVIT